MSPRILPFGDRALLVEVDALADVLAMHARLAAAPPAGVVDLVPAARTVLVQIDPTLLSLAAARAWISGADTPAETSRAAAPVIDLPIVYDGADLAETAELLGLTPDELAARHAACEWTVAFTGFAPGFGYLVSLDWTFAVPRRASPRTRVPAGAVGLAGEFSAAYPRDTPGGWQLIGTTSAPLFDPDADPPALLAPGSRVRFVPAAATAALAVDDREASRHPQRVSRGRPEPGVRTTVGLTIREAGLLATVQDQGRPGRAAEGIAASGAADRAALRTANRLVGNAETAAGLEVTMGGLRAVAGRDLWFAVTGAWGPIHLDSEAVDPYTAHAWPAGAELHLDWFVHGARGYVAVRGGIDEPRTARSRATDLLAGIGPSRLESGRHLRVAGEIAGAVPVDDLHPWGAPVDDVLEVALAPGPRRDWFTSDAQRALFESEWTVSNEADRVGIRLDGPELTRGRDGELPSEGMLPGALQVPPSGRPVILGPDGPVTGGYPVIAVVTDAGRDALAQARPGTRIRFRHARPSG